MRGTRVSEIEGAGLFGGCCRLLRWASRVLTLCVGASTTHAQVVDQQLWGVTPYAAISATAVSGSTLYVGGNFIDASAVVGGGAVADAVTGALWEHSPRVAGSVNVVIPDGSGGWYIGGEFGGVGSVARANLAHIFASGRVDSWAPNPDGSVRSLFVCGQTLYVGGDFQSIGGHPRRFVAAVKMVTGEVMDWNAHVENGGVRAVCSVGRAVYIGGDFINVGGQLRYNLASVDETTGAVTAWDPEPDPSGQVRSFAVKGDTLFVAGDFGAFQGAYPDSIVVRSKLAAFDTRSGRLLDWDAHIARVPPKYTPDGGHVIFSMLLRGDDLLIGGSFNRVGVAVRPALAAVDTRTGEATPWDPGLGDVPLFSIPYVNAMALNGRTLYVSGVLDSLGHAPVRWVGALDVNTGVRRAWNPQPNLNVMALAASGDQTYVGGVFTSLGPAVPRHGLAAFDLRTGRVTAWDPNPNGQPVAMAVRQGTVYITGEFTQMQGEPRFGVAAVDSATGALLPWAPQSNGPVWAIALGDTTAYLGGRFTGIGGAARSSLVEVNLRGGEATSWDPAPNDAVTSIEPYRGSVYVGGWFTHIGGHPRTFLAELEPGTGQATGWDPDADAIVDCIAVEDTTVYASGLLTRLGGEARAGLGAVSRRSGLATAFRADIAGEARKLVVHNGVLYAGGDFTRVGGQTRHHLAAVAADDGHVLDWNPDPDSPLWALAADERRLYPGGGFVRMGSTAVSLVAALSLADLGLTPGGGSRAGRISALDVTNPFRAGGVVHFALRQSADVRLALYDVMGRRVRTLLDGEPRQAGDHELRISTIGLSAGCYFVRLTAGDEVRARTMALLP